MAQRRMFSKVIVKSEEFSVMPKSSQALYFHLGMDADDDGFIHPGQIMRAGGYQADDLKILLAKRFLLTFESGVIVIKHWLIHNLIQKDRHAETRYQEELRSLFIKEDKSYTDKLPARIDSVNILLPQVRLGKGRKGKVTNTVGVDFPVFWELYPKKVEKKKTEDKWKRLDLATQQFIIADLKKRILGEKWSKDGGRFIEMPTTYLNGERWNDEIILVDNINKSHKI